MVDIRREDFAKLLLDATPFLDVRAEIEFAEGSMPFATNIPILNTEERATVGTTYKQQGQESAISLGHQLVSGANKEAKVAQWVQWCKNHPHGILYCFRGGMRSRITQQWLAEAGIPLRKIEGGYKALRQFLLEELEANTQFFNFKIISGATGSGKTRIVQSLLATHPALDLEKLANHLGSAFGAIHGAQPTQINFDNSLAVALMKMRQAGHAHLILEDESRLIGRRALPLYFHDKMKASPVYVLQIPMEQRIANIFEDYISNPLANKNLNVPEHFNYLKTSATNIQKKLGGIRYQEIIAFMDKAFAASLEHQDHQYHPAWIERLLVYYYDPIYQSTLERNHPTISATGNLQGLMEWL